VLIAAPGITPALGAETLRSLDRKIKKEESQLRRIEKRLAQERDLVAKGRLQTETILAGLDRLSARLAVEDQRLRLLARRAARSKMRHREILGKAEKLREEQEERKQTLRRRLRALYMGGSAGSVRLIVMSQSVWDLVDRWSFVTRLTRHDQRLLLRYREVEARLGEARAEAEAEVERQSALKKKQARVKARLARYYSRRSRRLTLLEKNKSRRRQVVKALVGSRDAMRDAITSLMKSRDSRIDRDAVLFDKMEGRLPWPAAGEIIREGNGEAGRGIRIRAGKGASVRSVASGEVVYSDWVRGYGRLLILRHGAGIYTVYGGAGEVLVERGEKVGAGRVIARVGTTGALGESALYFEIRRGSIPLKALKWLVPRG
jgi:septal ring factor EnvC (AmiA/AmiB activator)